MELHGFALLPVPEGEDAPDWPAHVEAFVDAIDPHLVQHVEDIAERNSRLAAAPVGTVAASTTDGTVWFFSDAGWKTWWEPEEAWRTLSLTSQFSPNTPCQVRRVGSQVWLRGRYNHDDSNIPVNGIKVTDVPSDCIPDALITGAVGISLTGANETAAARLEVYSATTTAGPNGPGSVLLFLGTISPNVPWGSLDITYWID